MRLWEKSGFCLDIQIYYLWLTHAFRCEVFAFGSCACWQKGHILRDKTKLFTSFPLLGAFLSRLLPTLTRGAVKKRSFSYKCIWDEFESLTAAMKLSCSCVSIQSELYTMRVISCCLLTNRYTFAGGRHLKISDSRFRASRLSPN